MSRSSFAARFKETAGSTPIDCLIRWRMLLAGDRLKDSGDPISVISRSLGYESESAFSTAFKSRTTGLAADLGRLEHRRDDLTVVAGVCPRGADRQRHPEGSTISACFVPGRRLADLEDRVGFGGDGREVGVDRPDRAGHGEADAVDPAGGVELQEPLGRGVEGLG